MHPAQPHDAGGPEVLLPTAAVLLLAAGYLLLVRLARRRNPGRSWGPWRTVSFLAGCVLLLAAVRPPLASLAHHDFRGHMAEHMLIGMYAPLALVLGAPVTLLLRTLPTTGARRLTGLLRSHPAHLLAHPVTALLLSTGGLVVLYFTPVYDATMDRPVLHWLTHLHFLLSGYLFAWVIAGPDPAPARTSVPVRLVILGVAIGLHAAIAQLMYGGFLIDVHAPIPQIQAGAMVMYYGGDIAELLLAAALVATWRPDRHRPGPAATSLTA